MSAVTRVHRWVAATDLFVASLLLGGIWGGLPARWWPVDVGGTAIALMLIASAIGLWRGARWASLVARASSATALTFGVISVSALALAAAQIVGLYGPVGSGGALLLSALALLVLPYLVVFPAAKLYLLATDEEKPSPAPP